MAKNQAEPVSVRETYDLIQRTIFQKHEETCLISMPIENYESQMQYIDYFIQEDEGHLGYEKVDYSKGTITFIFKRK
jgi:hypothetical protein